MSEEDLPRSFRPLVQLDNVRLTIRDHPDPDSWRVRAAVGGLSAAFTLFALAHLASGVVEEVLTFIACVAPALVFVFSPVDCRLTIMPAGVRIEKGREKHSFAWGDPVWVTLDEQTGRVFISRGGSSPFSVALGTEQHPINDVRWLVADLRERLSDRQSPRDDAQQEQLDRLAALAAPKGESALRRR